MSTSSLLTTAGSWLEPEITLLTEDIWLQTLRLAVHRVDGFPKQAGERTMDGFINITGDWQGAVVVQAPVSLAVRVATIMFELGHRQPTLEDMQDALGEIANMTGGNIKALMDGSCHLSLPAVVEGTDNSIRMPGTEVITRVVFACDDLPLVVSLLAAAKR